MGRRATTFGADGIFDDKSTDASAQLWTSHHHCLLADAGAALVGALWRYRSLR